MRISVQAIQANAADRPAGYVADVLASGTVNCGWLEVEPESYQRLRLKYGKAEPRGLGDMVAAVAQPIAKAIDAMAGTNLQNCGGCKKRREWLNGLTKC